MKQSFHIFATVEFNAFCEFINGLAAQKKKFHVTPWLKPDKTNGGFVVWYFK